MSIFHNLLCEGDIVLKRMLGAVYHDGRKAAVDARLADIEIRAVVEMESEVNAAVLSCRMSESHEISMLCILACAGGNLKYDRRFLLCRSFGDSLNYLHIVDVEGAYGIAALISLFEHFLCCYYSHFLNLFPAGAVFIPNTREIKFLPSFILYYFRVFCNRFLKIFENIGFFHKNPLQSGKTMV